ncbi:hypothetical protein [Candidatus Borrarchaeum sp.]|uniref:hypothetical protein n=1 Tax=Candidatus Borrarchaeum sp. TaxID=2846742 RepID=UPI00257A7F6E|nr:hypothetical protein [Candidatus Borrarchaeum sp.]
MKISFRDIKNKKLLILGEVASGKTQLLIELLQDTLQYADKITLLDFAPSVKFVKGMKIGGRVNERIEMPSNVDYLCPERVETPRLTAAETNSAKQLLRLAHTNAKNMSLKINEFLKAPTNIVFINDISLLFQVGNIEPVEKLLEIVNTAVITGYYGKKLEEDLGTGVSKKERTLMQKLSRQVDLVINLNQ